MSGHTPGPWRIGRDSIHNEIAVVYQVPTQPKKDGKAQGWVYIQSNENTHESYCRTPETQLANARLIAAAPMLLEALKKSERFIAGFEGDELQEGIADLLSDARVAIQSATQDR